MRSARLLLAVPAATALVLSGTSPAWAGGDDNGHHHDDDAWAEILEIDDEAELEDDGDEVDEETDDDVDVEDDDDKDHHDHHDHHHSKVA